MYKFFGVLFIEFARVVLSVFFWLFTFRGWRRELRQLEMMDARLKKRGQINREKILRKTGLKKGKEVHDE